MDQILTIERTAENMPIRVRVREIMEEQYGEDKADWPSIASVAKILKVQRQTVHLWLKGDIGSADLRVLDRWCRFLHVEPGDILVRED